MALAELSGGGKYDGTLFEVPDPAPPTWQMQRLKLANALRVSDCATSFDPVDPVPTERVVFRRCGLNDRGVIVYREWR